jgi:hypothetical protein
VEQQKIVSELTEAVRNAVVDVKVAGKILHLHKWTWRQGLTHGDKFINAIGEVVRGKSISDLLKNDVLLVLRNQAEVMAHILIDTIWTEDNFESREMATEWFDTLSLDEVVNLLGHVMRQNYVPLRDAFSDLKRVVLESGGSKETTATS